MTQQFQHNNQVFEAHYVGVSDESALNTPARERLENAKTFAGVPVWWSAREREVETEEGERGYVIDQFLHIIGSDYFWTQKSSPQQGMSVYYPMPCWIIKAPDGQITVLTVNQGRIFFPVLKPPYEAIVALRKEKVFLNGDGTRLPIP